MSKIHISGIVLRSKDKVKTADFYSRLGLTVRDHQHGGPMHYEVKDTSQNFVAEIYQNSERFSRDAIMIEVEHLQNTLKMIEEGSSDLKETETVRYVYVKDPDGRDVMLIEQNDRNIPSNTSIDKSS